MSVTTHTGETYYALLNGARTGATGTITAGLEWPSSEVAVTATAADIVESAPGSYVATRVAPLVAGTYVIVWADPGDPGDSATETLTVLPAASPDIDTGARALRRSARSKQRAVTGMGATCGMTYGLDGDPVPTGSVTVLVVNAGGEAVFTGSAARVGSTNEWTVSLPSASLSMVDDFAIVWTAVVSGDTRTDVTELDVCSARLFTLAQMRALPDVTDGYTDGQIEFARVAAEDFLEAACGKAFVLRYFEGSRNQVEWYRHAGLRLAHPDVQTLRALVIGGVPVDADGLSAYTVGERGYLFGPAGGGSVVHANVDVAYEHGATTPDAGRAALVLARHLLINGPLDDRATGLSVEGGGVIQLLTPGVKGSLTGLPEVDAFIMAHAA